MLNRVFIILCFSLFTLLSYSQEIEEPEGDSIPEIEAIELDADEQVLATADSILSLAKRYLDYPYRSGGKGPNSFDCSGFTGFVFSHFGYKLNASSGAQAFNGVRVKEKKMQRGDLVFFNGRSAGGARIGHVGIINEVREDGTFNFIHAACHGGVIISESTEAYYKRRYKQVNRVIGQAKVANKVPKAIASTPEPDDCEIRYHKVKRGDTLYSLAKQYGTTVDKLKKANKLKSGQINIGQRIVIE